MDVLSGVVEGSGDGEGLVLLHPIGLDRTFWGGLVDTVGRGRRVLSLDLRGHGQSPKGEPRLPIEAYADDVLAAIRHHGMGRPAVLGLSFGGMIAQTLALRHPEAISRLLLCGCAGGIPPEARPILQERGLAAERGGMEAIIPATMERWFTPGFADDARLDKVRERLSTDDVQAWSDGWHAIAGFNALPHLGELRLPAVIIAGDRDAATPMEAAKNLAGAIPAAELVVLPNAPHMMQIETEDLFVETVSHFLPG